MSLRSREINYKVLVSGIVTYQSLGSNSSKTFRFRVYDR